MPSTITGSGVLKVSTPVKVKKIRHGILGMPEVQVEIDGSSHVLAEGDVLEIIGTINLAPAFKGEMTVRDALKVIQKELSSD